MDENNNSRRTPRFREEPNTETRPVRRQPAEEMPGENTAADSASRWEDNINTDNH